MARYLMAGLVLTIIYFTSIFAASSHPEQKAIFRAINFDQMRYQPKLIKVIKGYACVIGICKLNDCDNEYYYLKKTRKGWQLVETGTGIEDDDLIKDGFPPKIAKELNRLRYSGEVNQSLKARP